MSLPPGLGGNSGISKPKLDKEKGASKRRGKAVRADAATLADAAPVDGGEAKAAGSNQQSSSLIPQ